MRTKLDIYVFITVLEDATITDVLMAYNKLAHPRINVTSTVIVQHSLTLNRIVEFVSNHRYKKSKNNNLKLKNNNLRLKKYQSQVKNNNLKLILE